MVVTLCYVACIIYVPVLLLLRMSCYVANMLQGIDGRAGVPGPEGEKGDKVRRTIKVCHVTPQVINLLAFTGPHWSKRRAGGSWSERTNRTNGK